MEKRLARVPAGGGHKFHGRCTEVLHKNSGYTHIHTAIDAYSQTLQTLQDPPGRSAEPKATVSTLTGLGDEAFSATQVFRRGGAVTDVATVVVRYHNVVVTVTVNGLQHSNRGTYGPVCMSGLSSAALAFAQAAAAALH